MNCSILRGQPHPLVEIARHRNGGMEDVVVRWCPQCGGVVVDADVDNRTSPGAFMKMRFPVSAYPTRGEVAERQRFFSE